MMIVGMVLSVHMLYRGESMNYNERHSRVFEPDCEHVLGGGSCMNCEHRGECELFVEEDEEVKGIPLNPKEV